MKKKNDSNKKEILLSFISLTLIVVLILAFYLQTLFKVRKSLFKKNM